MVASSAIYYDPDPATTIIQADQDLLANRLAPVAEGGAKSPWLFRFELDPAKLTGRDLSILTIEDRLREELQDKAEDEADQLDIVYHGDLERGERDRQVLRLRVPDMADGTTPAATAQKKTEDWLLTGLSLKGVPNITKVSYSDSKERGKKKYDAQGAEINEKGKNWIIETDGLALKEILAVDKVDYARTMSNSVKEVLQVLGVEASR